MSSYLPPHISKEAQEFLKSFPPFELVEPLQPDDIAGWEAMRAALHPIWQSFIEGLEFEYKLTDTTIGNIPCVWMETLNTKTPDKILYYLYSGSYCLGEPKVNAALPLQIAHTTGIKVLAVNYRKAPEYPYPAGLDDVVNVYKNLLKQGYSPKNIAWFGDSAGGGLTAAGIMRLKTEQIPLPAAIGLISPWADLTGIGDTYHTLSQKDPMLYSWEAMIEAVWAYCGNKDASNPLVSPVYGNFKDFPPLLIQAGTKEILLSDAIRLYQKAKAAGVEVHLDIWDGMWHVFQALPQVPEAQQACREMGVFLKRHLS